MATLVADQSTENIRYLRELLRDKDPAFAAVLELAADLVCQELSSTRADPGAGHAADSGVSSGGG